MRVIAGKSGGIPLVVPKSLTRPTTDRVREAIFSSLGDLVEDADALDLFAGSGSLGIECLSRGAKSALFIEENRAVCDIISRNLTKTRLSEAGTVRKTDVGSFLKRLGSHQKFDLIFADPPYARDETSAAQINDLVTSGNLASALNADGIFVLESFAREPLPENDWWETAREKKYGDTRVNFLVRKSVDAA